MASKSDDHTSGAHGDRPDLADIPAASESNEARKRKSRLNITYPVEMEESLKPAAERLGLNRMRTKRKPRSSDR